jgi:hypothetical protein
MATDTSTQNGCSSGHHESHKQSSTSVSYIPPQSDSLAVTSSEAARNGPFVLAIRDVVTFVRMLYLFPTIFIPFWTTNPREEFYLWDSNLFGLIALTFASVIPIVLLLLAIPAFVVLPGSVCVLVIIAGTVLIRIICKPFEGPGLVTSEPPTDEAVIARQHLLNSERWIFLNGCCVTGHALQQNLNLLSETFGRPVQGVHNETWGILGDIVECIIQRAFGFYSKETRIAYEFVKAYCSDPKVKKVVLIGHSQGGIMVSQVLDELFIDLPSESIAKLEVYTFGNAASHFNNPLRKPVNSTGAYSSILGPSDSESQPVTGSDDATTASPTTMVSPMTPLPLSQKAMFGASRFADPTAPPGSRTQSRNLTISPYLPKRVIPHIEHYCNSEDMVTRWGTLYSVKNVLGNRFCGHVFIYEGASGHMLNQHYLANMFPIHRPATNGWDSEDIPFLDRVVEVDSATVSKRDVNAAKQLTVLRQDSLPLDAVYSQTSISASRSRISSNTDFEGVELGEGDELREQDLAGAEGSRITVARTRSPEKVQGRGKKVRDLSRLWRYMGGESPLD